MNLNNLLDLIGEVDDRFIKDAGMHRSENSVTEDRTPCDTQDCTECNGLDCKISKAIKENL